MDIRDSAPTGEADLTAAMPLAISEETASRTDDLLREFAEEAGLDTALVVDRSGALVAGISAEADVTVEVISALVAGASGAMRALVAQLGETGAMESLHLGGNRLIYLKETVHRFILVAVAEAARPAGLVRQQALAIEGRLADLLRDVRPADPPVPAVPALSAVKSLRETVRERAARRQSPPVPPLLPVFPGATVTEPVFELDSGEDEEDEDDFEEELGFELDLDSEEMPEVVSEVEEPVVLPCDEEPGIEESFETLDLQPELEDSVDGTSDAEADPIALGESTEVEAGTEPSPVDEATLLDLPEELPPPPGPVEPKEILEPIDFGEPEIVIESAAPGSRPPIPRIPVDSPFEAEEDEEESDEEAEEFPESGSVGDSVFEYDAEEEEEDGELIIVTSPEKAETVPTGEDHEPEPANIPPPLPGVPPTSLFEADEEEYEEEDEEAADDAGDPFEFEQETFDEADEADEAGEETSDEAGVDFATITGGVQETILFEMPLEPAPRTRRPSARRKEAPPVPNPSPDEEAARELGEMIDEEEEESEIRSSGPFYF